MDDFLRRVVAQREAEQAAKEKQASALAYADLPPPKPARGPRGGLVTRYLKCTCACGYSLRTSRKWLDLYGPPLCPNPKCERAVMQQHSLGA